MRCINPINKVATHRLEKRSVHARRSCLRIEYSADWSREIVAFFRRGSNRVTSTSEGRYIGGATEQCSGCMPQRCLPAFARLRSASDNVAARPCRCAAQARCLLLA